RAHEDVAPGDGVGQRPAAELHIVCAGGHAQRVSAAGGGVGRGDQRRGAGGEDLHAHAAQAFAGRVEVVGGGGVVVGNAGEERPDEEARAEVLGDDKRADVGAVAVARAGADGDANFGEVGGHDV